MTPFLFTDITRILDTEVKILTAMRESTTIRFSKIKNKPYAPQRTKIYNPFFSGWMELHVGPIKRFTITIINSDETVYRSDQNRRCIKRVKCFEGMIREGTLVLEKTSQKIIKRIHEGPLSPSDPECSQEINVIVRQDETIKDQKSLHEKLPAYVAEPFRRINGKLCSRRGSIIEMVQKGYTTDLYKAQSNLTDEGLFELVQKAAICISKIHELKGVHGDVKFANFVMDNWRDRRIFATDVELFGEEYSLCAPFSKAYFFHDSIREKKGLLTRITDIWGFSMSIGQLLIGQKLEQKFTQNQGLSYSEFREIILLRLREMDVITDKVYLGEDREKILENLDNKKISLSKKTIVLIDFCIWMKRVMTSIECMEIYIREIEKSYPLRVFERDDETGQMVREELDDLTLKTSDLLDYIDTLLHTVRL